MRSICSLVFSFIFFMCANGCSQKSSEDLKYVGRYAGQYTFNGSTAPVDFIVIERNGQAVLFSFDFGGVTGKYEEGYENVPTFKSAKLATNWFWGEFTSETEFRGKWRPSSAQDNTADIVAHRVQ